MSIFKRKGLPLALAGFAASALVLSACSGAGSTTGGGSGGEDDTITALMVGNPQMEDIQKLTADNFTKQTGITVKFTILPENELRDKVTQDVANQGGQYDVVTVGAYEVPIWSKNGWLHELSTPMAADAAYDQARPAQADGPVADRRGRQDVRGAVLRRVVVPDVQQGHVRGQGPDHAGAPDLGPGRGLRRQGWTTSPRASRASACAACPAGARVRPADHRRQHVRRHLVREGLDPEGQRAGVQGGHQLLRQPDPQLR